MTRVALALLLCACIVVGVGATLQDGLPRPVNYPDEPSTEYGPEPMLTQDGVSVACAWYGFSNLLYADAVTSACQATLRAALINETANPASDLRPYVYYTLMKLIDPATNESYCYQGCFNLALSASPPPATAPPPYVRGPALAPQISPAMAPMYQHGPSMAPMYHQGPSMAPGFESPYQAPAMSPGN